MKFLEKNRIKKEKGTVLAYVLVIMTIVTIILVSMVGYIASQLKFSFNRVDKAQAFQIAEAGIYYYRWYLAHQTSGKTAQQIDDFWQSEAVLGIPSYETDYEGLGMYRLEVTRPAAGSTAVTVKSTGWTYGEPGMKRIVQVRFRRPSWSEYMFLVNDYMSFGTEAEVFGKVYSSKGIRFDGKAHNVVSSLVPSFNDPTHGPNSIDSFGVHTHVNQADPQPPAYPWPAGTVPYRPDIFEAGREFPVPEISFNGVTTDLANMKTQAQKPGGATINSCTASGCYFDATGSGRRIIFKNSTFDICTVDDYHHVAFSISRYKKNDGVGTCNSCSDECVRSYDIPDNGIIFVENNVWVEGTTEDKRVTLAAANLIGGNPADIYIGLNNLRMAHYNCDNSIGLVSQRDITIVRDCPNDFVVDAALLAQTGRVSRNTTASNKNSLTFNGAIASYLKPYFNNGVNGFGIRTYNFNNDLLYCAPPYFPTGTDYAIDLWEEL